MSAVGTFQPFEIDELTAATAPNRPFMVEQLLATFGTLRTPDGSQRSIRLVSLRFGRSS